MVDALLSMHCIISHSTLASSREVTGDRNESDKDVHLCGRGDRSNVRPGHNAIRAEVAKLPSDPSGGLPSLTVGRRPTFDAAVASLCSLVTFAIRALASRVILWLQ